MAPIAGGAVTPGRSTKSRAFPPVRTDAVRFVVHALLVLYLSPVILIVCLLGAASVAAGEVTGLIGKVSRGPARGKGGKATGPRA